MVSARRKLDYRKNMRESQVMTNSIINPEPPENAAIRSQIYRLVLFAVLLFSALIAAMAASFVGILPKWVATACSLAALPAVWFLPRRAQSIRCR